MVRRVEQPRTPAVARKHERSGGSSRPLDPPLGEEHHEVVVGRSGVAHVELHGLPHAHGVPDRKHPHLGVGTDDVAHEKRAPLTVVLIFARGAADVERRLDELLRLGIEACIDLAKTLEGRAAAQLDDQVFLRLRDHERLADRPASLRDDGADRRAADHDADGARVVRRRPHDERVAARPPAAAGVAADHGNARVIFVHAAHEPLDVERKRIGEQEERGIGRPFACELVGPAEKHAPIHRLRVFERERHDRCARQPRQPDHHRGPRFVFVPAGEHRLGRRREHMRHAQFVGEPLEGGPHRRVVASRHEHDREISGIRTQARPGLGGGRLDRRGDVGVGRDPHGTADESVGHGRSVVRGHCRGSIGVRRRFP